MICLFLAFSKQDTYQLISSSGLFSHIKLCKVGLIQKALVIFTGKKCNFMSISVENLSKEYGKQLAVDQLTFTVNKGEILGFLGPNGAGKSTTLKMITGYLSPTQGQVFLEGYSLLDQSHKVKGMLGYLPEHNPLYPDMYIHEFLRFICKLHGIKGKEARTRIDQTVEKTGLRREQHKKIRELSKGYRQRVGIAQALIHDPEILILDEPTTGLDPNQLVEIRQLIQEVGKNKTVIFSSHLLSEVEAIAQRVLILHKGKLQADKVIGSKGASDSLSSSISLELILNKDGFLTDALSAHPKVQHIDQQGPEKWLLYVEELEGIRELIFQECVRQGFVVYGLKQQAQSLAHLFTEFTQEEE